jgi:hypothetical protein
MRILFLFGFLLSACATSPKILSVDYEDSTIAFKHGLIANAINEFPEGEAGGFITSVEKSWLNFWNGFYFVEDLQSQVKTFESRKFISISREAKYFFFQESEDGYIPSEHEVVILHLLLAMNQMKLENWEFAKVEARKAAYYLQGFFSDTQPHFDDPALRIWLAGIWAALGEWNEAQVDLRRAAELSKNPEVRKLSDRRPPKSMQISFNGVGPTYIWKEGQFLPSFMENKKRPEKNISFSTYSWVERHKERNHVIRDKILKSSYMAQYYSTKASVASERAFGKTLGTALITVGAIAGTAAALATWSKVSNFEIGMFAAIVVGGYPIHLGMKMIRDTERSAKEHEANGLRKLKNYRMVGFMPDWVSIDFSQPKESSYKTVVGAQAPGSKTATYFVHEFDL